MNHVNPCENNHVGKNVMWKNKNIHYVKSALVRRCELCEGEWVIGNTVIGLQLVIILIIDCFELIN